MLRKPARSGELTAKDVDQRRCALRCIFLQDVIAGCFLRLARTIIIERTHAGISPDDILKAHRLLEILTGTRAEIIGFFIADRDLGRIAMIVLIGGTNQRKIVFVRDGEDDTSVIVLEEIGTWIGEFLRTTIWLP